jgi:hypothetical protein
VTIGQGDGSILPENPGNTSESAFKICERTTRLASIKKVDPDAMQNGGNIVGMGYGLVEKAVDVWN